jgi:hypothetical protein
MEPENHGFYEKNGKPDGKVKASVFVPFTAKVRAVSLDMSVLYKNIRLSVGSRKSQTAV